MSDDGKFSNNCSLACHVRWCNMTGADVSASLTALLYIRTSHPKGLFAMLQMMMRKHATPTC